MFEHVLFVEKKDLIHYSTTFYSDRDGQKIETSSLSALIPSTRYNFTLKYPPILHLCISVCLLIHRLVFQPQAESSHLVHMCWRCTWSNSRLTMVDLHTSIYIYTAVLASNSFQALVDYGVRHVVLCSRSGSVSADAPGQLAQRLL